MRQHRLFTLVAAFLCLVCCRNGADAFLSPCALPRTGGASGKGRLPLRLGAARGVGGPAGKAVVWRCSAASVLEKDIADKVASDAAAGWGGYDRAERFNTPAAAMRPWNALWNHLASHPAFVDELWAKQPFKLSSPIPFAVGCFGLAEIEAYSHTYPAHYAASGVLTKQEGGWMMKGMAQQDAPQGDPTAMQFSDIQRTLATGTVSLSNAGFFMPPAAAICASLLEAVQLPIWLNIYVTQPGKASSAPPHTDKQDVIAVQAQGAKRWRVFAPPSPNAKMEADPFTRGKGTDILSLDELEAPLIDTVLEPGQVLYIPAGFPHVTDTCNGVTSPDTSVHLTLGVDTHVWDLSYACMRASALRRAGLSPLLSSTFSLNKLDREDWLLLHAPLPLGFSAAAVLPPRGASPADAEALLVQHMASSLGERMITVEPERWAGRDAAALVEELSLGEVAERYLTHYRNVMAIERQVYADAVYQTRPITATYERAQPHLDALTNVMQGLGAWSEGKPEPTPPPSTKVAGGKEAGKGMGAAKSAKSSKAKAKGSKGFG